MRDKRTLLYLVTAILGVAGLLLFLRYSGVDWNQVWTAIRRFDAPTIFLVAACSSFQALAHGVRLGALVPRSHWIGWIASIRSVIYGQCMNAFLPARAGDALKALNLHKESRNGELSLMSAAGVLVGDKIVDVVSFIGLCLLAGGLGWQEHLPTISFALVRNLALALLLMSGLSYALFRFRPNLRVRARALVQQLAHGVRPLGRPTQALTSLTFSVAGWLGEMQAIRILAGASGVELTFSQAVFALAVLNLGISVPISFANLGAFEAALVFALSRVGVPPAQGLAIATLHHGIQIVVLYFWGGILTLEKRIPQLPWKAQKTH